jgi:lipid-binding SYLF domain-containing protein
MRLRVPAAVSALLALALAFGCTSPAGNTAADKRLAVHNMRQDTLAKLYQLKPEARAAVERADGYAVFSTLGVNVVFVAFGNGWGVVRDNRSGQDTYMKMATGGLGPGLGAKDFRVVFVFKTRRALDEFVTFGWDAGGSADATAKSTTRGAEAAAAGSIDSDIEIYQITEAGLAVQATIGGTRYWRDDELG